jgi:hypothetical protein
MICARMGAPYQYGFAASFAKGLSGYFRGGLGGCRSTTTESGCETMVMNQIELTTSDQNVFQ